MKFSLNPAKSFRLLTLFLVVIFSVNMSCTASTEEPARASLWPSFAKAPSELRERLRFPDQWYGRLSLKDYVAKLQEGGFDPEVGFERVTLHHTVNGNELVGADGLIDPEREPEVVREIQQMHMDWGWASEGYHAMIGQSGAVYLSRPEKALGSHTGGANRHNFGLAFIGKFDEDPTCLSKSTQPLSVVTEAMMDSALKVVSLLSQEHGFPLTEDRVMARSEYDLFQKGHSPFPFSPGRQVIDKWSETLKRAELQK